MNTRKGANGELFIDSISDSAEKSNSFDKNSSKNADSGARSALARDIKTTSSDVKEEKVEIAGYGIEPGGIVELADSYLDEYSGDFNRTTMRELFLDSARGMLDSDTLALKSKRATDG